MKTFRFREIALAPDHAFVLSRVTVPKGQIIPQHTHDFAEIHWVEQGEALHQVNGESVWIRPRHLLQMRPSDVHGFECGRDCDLVLVIVVFLNDTLAHIRRRYFPDSPSFYGGTSPLPQMLEMESEVLRRTSEQADLMANSPRTVFHIERFLLNLFFTIENSSGEGVPLLCPDWLRRAYLLIQNKEALSGGTKTFQQICNRSEAHVSRSCKQWFKATPSQIVNRFRMDYAARELSMTERPILEISMDCGFDSLSHFYRLFRERYNISPHMYRVRNKVIAGGKGLES